jgi:hypothetical protein
MPWFSKRCRYACWAYTRLTLLACIGWGAWTVYSVMTRITNTTLYLHSDAAVHERESLRLAVRERETDRLIQLKPEQLAEKPQLWRVPGFLTPAECDFLVGAYAESINIKFPLIGHLLGRSLKEIPRHGLYCNLLDCFDIGYLVLINRLLFCQHK